MRPILVREPVTATNYKKEKENLRSKLYVYSLSMQLLERVIDITPKKEG